MPNTGAAVETAAEEVAAAAVDAAAATPPNLIPAVGAAIEADATEGGPNVMEEDVAERLDAPASGMEKPRGLGIDAVAVDVALNASALGAARPDRAGAAAELRDKLSGLNPAKVLAVVAVVAVPQQRDRRTCPVPAQCLPRTHWPPPPSPVPAPILLLPPRLPSRWTISG